MNSQTTLRATALVCAACATLAVLLVTDALFMQAMSGTEMASAVPATPAAQVVVVAGQPTRGC